MKSEERLREILDTRIHDELAKNYVIPLILKDFVSKEEVEKRIDEYCSEKSCLNCRYKVYSQGACAFCTDEDGQQFTHWVKQSEKQEVKSHNNCSHIHLHCDLKHCPCDNWLPKQSEKQELSAIENETDIPCKDCINQDKGCIIADSEYSCFKKQEPEKSCMDCRNFNGDIETGCVAKQWGRCENYSLFHKKRKQEPEKEDWEDRFQERINIFNPNMMEELKFFIKSEIEKSIISYRNECLKIKWEAIGNCKPLSVEEITKKALQKFNLE